MANLIPEFIETVNSDSSVQGDLLEFGTGHGHSTARIAELFKKGKIYTFDGFVGLPETKKCIPHNTGWTVGAYPSSEQATKEYLKKYDNVVVTRCMTWELKEPAAYGIQDISSVNIDVDLYEGTIDALRFSDKCNWKELVIRFDDWGYYEGHQIKEEVAEHEEAAFYDFINETKYKYTFYTHFNDSVSNRQFLAKVYR